MIDHEINELAGLNIDRKVSARIEASYIESGYDRYHWFNQFGHRGVIKCYDDELKAQYRIVSEFARSAIDALQRLNSSECIDGTGRTKDYAAWKALETQLVMVCDILEINVGVGNSEELERKLRDYVVS
jgi:hypothetical protein